jgi:hypothetical protein
MSAKYYYFLLILIFPLFTFGQGPTQTIRGTVIDADTRLPLIGASVIIPGSEPLIGTSTNQKGSFRLDNLPLGYYQLEVSNVGYQTVLLTQLLLESGKELVLNVPLTEATETLDAVVLTGKRSNPNIGPVSIKTITQEEVLRFPGTFYDPARLAMTFAGVASTDDQANNISIRGNSPNSMAWRLEGLEIVNPNHLSNAGTFSDRPAQNGGGVNILSAQLLSTSYFMTGAFPANYGNALSGIMDMQLRPGNNEQWEFTGQAGFVGIDLSAEGPLTRRKNSSLLVNYRYSFTGLLSNLGVDLGDEDIRFQDFSFHLNIPTTNAGKFTIFGIDGRSQNTFLADIDSTNWEFQKDRFDIYFENDMTAFGLTHTLPIGDRTAWNSGFVFSERRSARQAFRLQDDLNLVEDSYDEINEGKIAFNTNINHRFSANNRLTAGIYLTQFDSDVYSLEDSTEINYDGIDQSMLIQPYVSYQQDLLNNRLRFNIGLHYQYFTLNESQSLEPRASLRLRLSPDQNISLAYGLHSQVQQAQVYFANSPGLINENLGFTKSHHFVLSYERSVDPSTKLIAEAYYQSLFDVPISVDPNSSFSILNILEGFVLEDLVNEGTGENYGFELGVQKNFSNNFFFLVNASVFESKYTGADGIQRDTRFNSNYILNATAGREFRWRKPSRHDDSEQREKVFGLNARIAYYGGFRETPIDEAASRMAGTTVFVESEAFSIKQPAFFKVDLRLYWKNNRPKYSSTVSLDIQNATNRENVAYSYYDAQQGQVILKNQLGLIPILSYRIEF